MFKVADVFPEILFDVSDYDGDDIYELGEIFANNSVVIQTHLYDINNADVDLELYYDRNDNGRFDNNDELLEFSENEGTASESIEFLLEDSGLYFARVFNFEEFNNRRPNFEFSAVGILPENILQVSENVTSIDNFNLQVNDDDFPFDDVTIIEYEFPDDGLIRARVSSNSPNPDVDVFVIDDSNENGIFDGDDEILNEVSITRSNIPTELVFSVLEGSGFLALDNRDDFASARVTTRISYETANNPFVKGDIYSLPFIKDFDGNTHGLTNSNNQQEIANNYKFQDSVDVQGNGKLESVFTNSVSGRWATVEVDPITGNTNYSRHGSNGSTRVVGIYTDPLVEQGIVQKNSDFDSQRRFQNDLFIDNLQLRAGKDYDGDGFQELYWKTGDGTAYLRSLMHADGNIQYANYQSEQQMINYLNSVGHGSDINQII